jgi:glycerophosphoryl diester phosphodiesterase
MSKFFYGKPLILAHRCLYPGYPENTIPSLKKAIKEGADYVEIDCEYSKDKKMIVSHDHSVDRCTNGTGNIKDLSFDYIRSLNAANYLDPKEKEQFGKVQIPTIEEVFQAMKDTPLKAELHIKTLEVLDYEEYPKENVPELLVKYGIESRCTINLSTFAMSDYIYEVDRYQKCKFSLNAYIEDELSEDKQLKRLEGILKSLKESRFFGLDLTPSIIDKQKCDMIHDYGFELQCYPTNDPKEMQRLIESECDVIQTDRMDLLKNVVIDMGF